MATIPITNNIVQRILMDLIEDYCDSNGLTLTAEMLKKERLTNTIKNPDVLFPTEEVSKLEALIAEPLLQQIIAANDGFDVTGGRAKFTRPKSVNQGSASEEAASQSEKEGAPEQAAEQAAPSSDDVDIVVEERDVDEDVDEWSDDDSAGYFFTLVPEPSFNALVQDGERIAEERTRWEQKNHPKRKKKPESNEYESYDLRIIQKHGRTGFEPTKDFPIVQDHVIAGRYRIEELLGQAAFSRAVMCEDLVTKDHVCVKIITNNKDFFDQSLDEIKLLKFLRQHGDPDENCFLRLYDYFYHKEHLFIVCELLKDNLYEFYKFNHESGEELYFNIPRLRSVTRQILTALKFVHDLNIIHCDLKPENILIKSYSKCQVKVIDFGSSCFTTDHLSSYVQSRSYRAPEVMLGLPYDTRVDIWSLGCIVAELFTGSVLFLNDSIPTLLGRIDAIVGPFPKSMEERARYFRRYYTTSGKLFERRPEGTPVFIHPKRTTLRKRIHSDDTAFLDFLERVLEIDPEKRLTAKQALQHPWLQEA